MSSEAAVPYGITFTFEEGFCAVVVPTSDDLSPIPLRTQLFASSMFRLQGRTLGAYISCLVSLRDGTHVPPWCSVQELELLADSNRNGLLDARVSIDPSKLPM